MNEPNCVLIIENDLNTARTMKMAMDYSDIKTKVIVPHESCNINYFEDISLVLLDVSYNFEFIKSFMDQFKQHRQIPLILMSTNNNVEFFQKELEAEFCLHKPFDLDAFISAIKAHTNKQH